MKVLVKNGKTTGASAKLWECHELNFAKKSDEYICRFENNENSLEARAFARGEDLIAVRFMPQQLGRWNWQLIAVGSDQAELSGSFECEEAEEYNHGPVHVQDKYHFAYADGTIYRPFGTTSYGWIHQPEEITDQTLRSLANSSFNKIRMCILPHYSKWSREHTAYFPFVQLGEGWDFSKFDYRYFDRLDQHMLALQKLGVEADLILLHPYNDEWGFNKMPSDVDDRYIEYVVRRYAAFSNAWWSLANEYDLLKEKSLDDWRRFGQIIAREDPYKHLCSNHNYIDFYDYTIPEMTHCCIQDGLAVKEDGRAVMLRNAWQKPVIYDEVCYEGTFDARWGDLDELELAHRFWEGIAGGTYVGHGEVCPAPDKTDDEVWTGIGGELRGNSPARIGFLRSVLEAGPNRGLEPIDRWWYTNIVGVPGEYYLFYFGRSSLVEIPFHFPSRDLELPDGTIFRADIIDTLDMKIIPVKGEFSTCRRNNYEYGDQDGRTIKMPDKPYLALRLERVR
jgi:hypothetical protein